MGIAAKAGRMLLQAFVVALVAVLLSSNAYSREPDYENLAYGDNDLQTVDVYLPNNVENAPIIFMVHGGAWRFGDKTAEAVVKNKLSRWVSKGFIFVSANYRLWPEAGPLEQVHDIAKALAYVQTKAKSIGANSDKIILLGHSAGAHIISVLATSETIASDYNVKPWLGTISIDTAALDIVALMEREHFRLYDRVFGEDKDYWESVSPQHLLKELKRPLLAICSIQRRDGPCNSAEIFARKSSKYPVRAQVLKVDLSHREANFELGGDNPYTEKVELFMKTLDTRVAGMLESEHMQ